MNFLKHLAPRGGLLDRRELAEPRHLHCITLRQIRRDEIKHLVISRPRIRAAQALLDQIVDELWFTDRIHVAFTSFIFWDRACGLPRISGNTN